MSLTSYGIQNEKSLIRVHVCPIAKRVYVYPTQNGIKAIETGQYYCVHGYQNGIEEPTSKGYLVPPFHIKSCVGLGFRNKVWTAIDFNSDDTTSGKGDKAVKLVLSMIENGLFPFLAIVTANEITDKALQVEGQDIIISASAIHVLEDIVIQVKCDYPGGEKSLGGSGNLFLQIAESNPLKRY